MSRSAPRRASSSTIARPIPRPPPVTRASFPVSSWLTARVPRCYSSGRVRVDLTGCYADEPPMSNDIDLEESTIEQLQARLSSGEFSGRQLVEAYLARIDAIDRGGPTL